MMTLINILGLACLANVIVTATPIKMLLRYIGVTSKSESKVKAFIAQLLSCALCIGTWVGIIGTSSLAQGAIVAVLAELINRKISTIEL